MVDEATYRTTRHLVDYAALDPVSVKETGRADPGSGKPKPPAVDTAPIPPRRRPPLYRPHPRAGPPEGPVRSRRAEGSAQLDHGLRRAGVGKSRLVREFRAFVDWRPEHARWQQGRCLPYGEGITFWALGEIVKSQAGILESDSPHEASDKLTAAIGAVIEDPTERDWLKTRLALLVGASAPASGTRPRDQNRLPLGDVSSRPSPTTDRSSLVFEDVHWAGAALLEFVEYLVDGAAGLPFLVVCTTRPELFEDHPAWGAANGTPPPFRSPRSREETSWLIAAHLPGAELPGETQISAARASRREPVVRGRIRSHARRPRDRRTPGRGPCRLRPAPTSRSPRPSRP